MANTIASRTAQRHSVATALLRLMNSVTVGLPATVKNMVTGAVFHVRTKRKLVNAGRMPCAGLFATYYTCLPAIPAALLSSMFLIVSIS